MKWVLNNREVIALYEQWGVDMALDEEPQGLKRRKLSPPPPIDAKPQLVSGSQALSHIDTLRASLASLTSLDHLRQFQEQFQGCALKKTATNMVFGEGVANPLVMLVGEAPGADEDLQARPFVGKSGMLLDNILMSVGLSRQSNVYISNIIPWRPPGNRQPTLEETAICLPFVERHIELVNPQVLLLIGAVSAKALLNLDSGITTMRGQWVDYVTRYHNVSIRAMPLFHPAYLLRSPSQKQKVWADMLKLKCEFLDSVR